MTADLGKPWFPDRTEERIAIENVTVIPMSRSGTIPDQTVLVNGGRIEAIVPAGGAPVEGARVVDASGKYLMPGLADMHVHYWDAGEFGMFLANGVTTVRNMWGSPFHLALQKQVESGSFPGPSIITTSPIVDGPGPDGNTIWPGSVLCAAPAEAEPMVRDFAARGYRQTKAYSWLSLEVLQALGDASRKYGIRMVGHCPEGITYEQAIDAGMSCFEHLTGIVEGRLGGKTLRGLRMGSKEALLAVIDNIELDSVRRLAVSLAEQNIWNCTTLVVWQGMAQDIEIAMSNPLLRYEPGTTVAGWNPANDFRQRSTTKEERAEWLDLARARIDIYRQIITILREEGAPILLGTDTPNPFVYQGFAVHDELANFVATGFSPYEALRTGTVEAARFMGEEADWGAVEEGKRADLLLLDEDPLRDISAVRRPDAVFVNGFHFTRPQLDTLLEYRAAAVGRRDAVPADDTATSHPVLISAAPPPLPAPNAVGDVVREGVLVDRVAGVETGMIAYRHTRLPDGGWLVEESATSGADGLRSSGGTTSVRLVLLPSLEIVESLVRTESFLGVESCDVRSERDGGYSVAFVQIDGHRSESAALGPAAPAQDLSFTSILLLLSQLNPDPHRSTLGIEQDRLVSVPIRLSSEHANEWMVHAEHLGTSTDQTYYLTGDGELIKMTEQTWRGAREVVPLKK